MRSSELKVTRGTICAFIFIPLKLLRSEESLYAFYHLDVLRLNNEVLLKRTKEGKESKRRKLVMMHHREMGRSAALLLSREKSRDNKDTL